MVSIVNVVFFIVFIFEANARGVDNEDYSQLIALVQIFRHGERSPISFYTNDPHANSTHWNGLEGGQLTNKGKRQHLDLGRLTRSRYIDFLPERYNRDVVHATTTDVDRTHMSAQCNLYGLFPAAGEQVWEENLNWQPIPLHQSDPRVLNEEPYECPNYRTLFTEVWNTDEYAAVNEKYKDVYEYISTHTGDNITSAINTLNIFDCLEIENGVGLELPEWSKEVYPEPLSTLAGINLKSYTHTTEMKQLFVGPFLNEIIEYFYGMARNASYSQKYRIYSAHDNNIAAILNTFGAFDPPYSPAFASTIWIEMRQVLRKHYVNIYTKNNNEIKQITIQGCDMNCPLGKFKAYLEDVWLDVDTWLAKCSSTVSTE